MNRPERWRRLALWALPAAAGVFGIAWLANALSGSSSGRPAATSAAIVASNGHADQAVSHEQVERFCGACHAYPPADTFPKSRWDFEVRRGFDFYRQSGKELDAPPVDRVIAYYTARAPEALPVLPRTPPGGVAPVDFRRREVAGPRPGRPSGVAHVNIVRLSDPDRPDLLACDMVHGDLLALRAGNPDGPMTTLANCLHPAHVEVCDLDRDGIKDLLVADLGAAMPTDDRFGRVLWLRGSADGSYEADVLATGLGRVCDVQPADFDGDGDLDLVVAVFGWRRVGEILYLEQRPGRDGRPQFAPRTLDRRHGTIHVPVVDLNRDGRPDFVALISQEHETVVAFLNAGDGRFTPRTLYSAPHPAFGSSGIQLTDLDGDGDVDVLLTNGDVYDSPHLKPYHGVTWLENRGEGPFEPHLLGPLYGAHRAVAGDLDGDGDLDVVATSFLGHIFYDVRREVGADAVVLFEQDGPGRFVRHVLERETCDYPTVALGDLDGDGDLDIVAGSFRDFSFSGTGPTAAPGGVTGPLVIWENLGPRGKSAMRSGPQGR
jgi:hypothetical protein